MFIIFPMSMFHFFTRKMYKEQRAGSSSLGFKLVWNASSLALETILQGTYQWFFWPPCLSHLNSCPKFCFKTCSICSYHSILSAWVQGLAVKPFLVLQRTYQIWLYSLTCHFWQIISYLRDVCSSLSITLFPMGFRDVS